MVVELDQSLYPKPFPRWDNLLAFINNSTANNSEVKQISYNKDIGYSYHFNNNIRINSTSSDFNSARSVAINSGQTIKSQEYNSPDNWFITWGNNDFSIKGYSALQNQLATLKNQGKTIKQVLTVLDSQFFLILLSDNTYIASGINSNVLSALTNPSTIKRVSLSKDQKLAIIRNNGTLEFSGNDYSENELSFINTIKNEINTNNYQADTIYFGRSKEMIFTARKSGTTGIVRHMGPINSQTKISKVGNDMELEIFMSQNYNYQLQRCCDLQNWHNIGPLVGGNNTTKKLVTPIYNNKGFYRFSIQY